MAAACSRPQTPAGPTDPNFASVKLLTHFDASFVDSSASARAATAVGSVSISSTAKYGSGSALFASGQRIDYAGADLSLNLSGDFTVEAWIRFTSSFTTLPPVIERFHPLSGGWALRADTSRIDFSATTAGGTNTKVTSIVTRATGQWYHVAVTRSGSTYRLFVGGALLHTATDAAAIAGSTSTAVSVGGSPVFGTTFLGRVDDARITVGVARYTSAFTAPDAAFPDT